VGAAWSSGRFVMAAMTAAMGLMRRIVVRNQTSFDELTGYTLIQDLW